ncbi:MAG: hypothetical protein GAK28_04780 [Luteibacter sp.]|uniref:DUF2635 domain-containing protein n=1 Tax=Luteibacter sp. TaxID=1886636 RepID=UPI001380252E|nr:DUF2635 domain-containing protein [Luteibacter sp.]KAF1003341.1 MAG: hypothetical protein GAK28_04780 [Luteibacter sp.]
MYVKAAPGMKIRDPDLKDLLPDEGRDVPSSDYWHRRLRDGDVVEAEPPAAPVPKAEKAIKPDAPVTPR